MPLMAQIVTGGYWNKAHASEKAAATEAFKRINIATLATLFDGYDGELFKINGEYPGPSKTMIVATDLIKADKSKVSIAYVARKFNGAWRLIDVVVDGAQLCELSRAQLRLGDLAAARGRASAADQPNQIVGLDTHASRALIHN